MRKIFFNVLLLFVSITPAWPAMPDPYVDTPILLPHNTLTVTVIGSGSVVSTPAGMDCTNTSFGEMTCTHDFLTGSAVGMQAEGISGSGYTSHFYHWTGDCSGSELCVLIMNSDKNVTANFVALDIPVYALPVPTAGNIYPYLPVESPVDQGSKADCRPFAVGDLPGGVLNLQVGLHDYNGPVDIYLAIAAPSLSPEIFIITPGNSVQALSAGLVAWKSGVNSAVNESLFGNLPASILPSGTYRLYFMVTPAGSLSAYDLWTTYFTL